MNPLLASPDPVLRDEVAYSAAERWIVRDKRRGAGRSAPTARAVVGEPRRRARHVGRRPRVQAVVLGACAVAHRGPRGRARRFSPPTRRSGSSIGCSTTSSASAICAASTPRAAGCTPWRTPPTRSSSWPAGHTWPPANLARLLEAVRAKIESTDAVFAWGENDRMALALQAARAPPRRRPAAGRGVDRRGGCRTTRRCGPTVRRSIRGNSRGSRTPSRCCAALHAPGDGAVADAAGRERRASWRWPPCARMR